MKYKCPSTNDLHMKLSFVYVQGQCCPLVVGCRTLQHDHPNEIHAFNRMVIKQAAVCGCGLIVLH